MMAFGSSVAGSLTVCAYSAGAGTTGLTECHGSLKRWAHFTLDGEGVVCGPDGVADFDRLRAAVGRKGSRGAFLYVFDLLELDGQDLRREPWEARRDALASLLRNVQHDAKLHQGIQLSEHIDGADGDIVFRHACKLRLEGIVAKRRDRPYRSGRSPDWIKIKNLAHPAIERAILIALSKRRHRRR
jgi:ATP-dependent DNA ligase